MSVNVLILSGKIQRFTRSENGGFGTLVHERKYQKNDGSSGVAKLYIGINVWDKSGTITASLEPGVEVIVTGRFEQRKGKDEKYYPEIRCENIRIVDDSVQENNQAATQESSVADEDDVDNDIPF